MQHFNFIIATIICFASLNVYSEDERMDPQELIKILEDSKITYELKCERQKPFVNTKKFEKLTNNDYFQVNNGDKITLGKFERTDDIKDDFETAESFFSKKEYEKARIYYQKVLDKKPDAALMMTYIGQTYESMKDSKNAKEWYLKAVNANYVDYMAHWFLSAIYDKEGKSREAIQELVLAHILNRNNPRIITTLKALAAKNGLEFDDWYFTPLIEIVQSDKNKVTLTTYGSEWLYYGMCRLVWEYEPGYRDKRLKRNSEKILFSSIEIKECLVYLSFQQKVSEKEKTTNKQILTLMNAFNKKQVSEFVMYEILLPENPIIALTSPKEKTQKIVDYFINTRLEEIKK
ncbi:MAG TPA: hypothetical protein PKG52_00510 [bacterium]|nr:hypothetical protein [bacterium]HPS29020.1 hypothetical protein [bacterium]